MKALSSLKKVKNLGISQVSRRPGACTIKLFTAVIYGFSK